MLWSYVSVERRDGIAIVRFDRKAARNALDRRAIRELTEVADHLAGDTTLQAVVLTGTTTCFSAGFDIREHNERSVAEGPLERRLRAGEGSRLCAAWERMPQITVAAIEGYAIGGGFALCVALDWRVAGRGAFLTFPEVGLGLNLGWGTIPRLVSLTGPARTKRAVVLCERLDAETSARWGLVDEVAEDGAALEQALSLAARVAAAPALPVRMTKETVNAVTNALHPLAAHMDADQGQLSFDGPDFAEAAARFRRGKGG